MKFTGNFPGRQRNFLGKSGNFSHNSVNFPDCLGDFQGYFPEIRMFPRISKNQKNTIKFTNRPRKIRKVSRNSMELLRKLNVFHRKSETESEHPRKFSKLSRRFEKLFRKIKELHRKICKLPRQFWEHPERSGNFPGNSEDTMDARETSREIRGSLQEVQHVLSFRKLKRS